MTNPARAGHRHPSGRRRYYTAQQAAAAVAVVIAQAELAMLAALAHYVLLAVTGRLLAILSARRLRAELNTIISQAERQIRAAIAGMTAAARADVQQVIAQDLGPFARLLPMMPSPSAGRLSADLHKALQAALNDADAAYRRVTRKAATLAEAQKLLDELAARGLTGLIDRGGRRWDLLAYAEMSARTAAERMHIAIQVRALEEAGIDLVQVHRDAATPPCPKCLPWQHRVLSLTGRTPGFPTLAQARAFGLLHPSCRDSVAPYRGLQALPEPSPEWVAAQARRYEAERAARARWHRYLQARRAEAVLMTRRRRRAA